MNILLGILYALCYFAIGFGIVTLKYRFGLSVRMCKRKIDSDYMASVDTSEWFFEVMMWPLVSLGICWFTFWCFHRWCETTFGGYIDRALRRGASFLERQAHKDHDSHMSRRNNRRLTSDCSDSNRDTSVSSDSHRLPVPTKGGFSP